MLAVLGWVVVYLRDRVINMTMRFKLRCRSWLARYWASFSYVGLAVATLFFAASLTPSLLPRTFLVQGILSGFALAVGYGVGVFLVWLGLYLEIPKFSDNVQRVSKRITTVAVTVVVIWFLWRETYWQNSIRELMEMNPVEPAYPWRVALISLFTAMLVLGTARTLVAIWQYLARKITRFVPHRIAVCLSAIAVLVGVFLLVNDVVARLGLHAADAVFLRLDQAIEENVPQPTEPMACGGLKSLVPWDTIGRMGKHFIALGPTKQQISTFLGKEAKQPLRVYVGMNSKEASRERAQLALQELIRIGGFDRSVLVVATPTGTGWLDPGAVDTIEYMHGGDTAIVSVQYSYLPSWITIMVEPDHPRDSATYLFDEVYHYWKALPKDSRPKLYIHGLSLGALGSAASADLFTVFEDPINGALWSGPPFASEVWEQATRHRNPGSPMWLPSSRDDSMLRFTGRECTLHQNEKRWGPMRFVYIQHASDPMTFFSPDILYRKPDWLVGERGPDVSPHLRWFPIVTFLQVGFDIPLATTPPKGYGHNFDAASYIDAWVEVTEPPYWDAEDTRRLKELFANTPAKASN
jgi:uncharacterized membrane protein